MEEVWRILKSDGRVEIIVPSYKSKSAYVDPTHRHFFTERTMNWFLCEEDMIGGDVNSYYTDKKFSLVDFNVIRGSGFPCWHFRKYLNLNVGFAKMYIWLLEKRY